MLPRSTVSEGGWTYGKTRKTHKFASRLSDYTGNFWSPAQQHDGETAHRAAANDEGTTTTQRRTTTVRENSNERLYDESRERTCVGRSERV